MHLKRLIITTFIVLLNLVSSVSVQASELTCNDGGGYALVNVSVCNVRGEGRFTSGMETQALLGTPVRVLEFNGWYHIQTPDEYTGWVHRMVITPVSEEQLSEWNAAEKVVVTALFGQTYERPDESSQSVSDVVAGDRLKLTGSHGKFYRVEYPDGRVAYLKKQLAAQESVWRRSVSHDAKDIVKTARSMMGVPYLWAGMSPKGMDCSGFVRTVMFMHNVILPRDAWQQALVGDRIEIAHDFGNLQAADLVFFGTRGENGARDKVSHVGIYLGNGRFIHSLGDVHVSSFLPGDSCYDEFNTRRLLYGGRILPYINRVKEITTTENNTYYTK
jgi:cell wall-associated NlpC family hydrolase